jgi:hypothetical protein
MERQGRTLAPLTALAAVALALALSLPAVAQTTCRITGPANVGANERFTLCGPTGSGYTYEWYGPGLRSGGTTRCVEAGGLAAGTYEFLLVRKSDDVEVDRCVHIVNVGGRTGGTTSCRISGPTTIPAGGSATLCSPDDGIHSYRWSGPGGFSSTAACITVSTAGTYTLTSRNPFTGSSRTCTHHLAQVGGTDPEGDCAISGPSVVTEGSTARLCGTSRANTSYRWTGPGGFTATSRCVTVSGAGTYILTMRNLSTGHIDRCRHELSGSWQDDPGSDDPDQIYWDNCPRDLPFWRNAYRSGASGSGLSTTDLATIAREVDRRSTFFNWSNDTQGMRAALAPAAPLTRRKQIARQYAALLANLAAGELGLDDGVAGAGSIGLDADTRITFEGASTIGELAALTDRWLTQNRGNFNRLNSTLNQINRGRGIGAVCE